MCCYVAIGNVFNVYEDVYPIFKQETAEKAGQL